MKNTKKKQQQQAIIDKRTQAAKKKPAKTKAKKTGDGEGSDKKKG